jgi:non-ribosomal peptide synthetase component E (peptide arylation enzyme)
MYTFAAPLSRALQIAPDSCAVVSGDHRLSYAELDGRCRRLAGAMRKLGLAPQDRVGVIALNSDRYLELAGAGVLFLAGRATRALAVAPVADVLQGSQCPNAPLDPSPVT